MVSTPPTSHLLCWDTVSLMHLSKAWTKESRWRSRFAIGPSPPCGASGPNPICGLVSWALGARTSGRGSRGSSSGKGSRGGRGLQDLMSFLQFETVPLASCGFHLVRLLLVSAVPQDLRRGRALGLRRPCGALHWSPGKVRRLRAEETACQMPGVFFSHRCPDPFWPSTRFGRRCQVHFLRPHLGTSPVMQKAKRQSGYECDWNPLRHIEDWTRLSTSHKPAQSHRLIDHHRPFDI